MKRFKFIVEGRLPSLNQYIEDCRRNKFKGANTKKKWQRHIYDFIQKQLKEGEEMELPVSITYHFYEPNKKRDIDNVSSFFIKCCNDAIVESKILPNDTQQYVKQLTQTFDIDKDNPRIEVVIQTLKSK